MIIQQYTSANTSINSIKLPALFNKIKAWVSNSINLDFGGGKFDNATAFLKNLGVKSYIYDPYNRSYDHNQSCLSAIVSKGFADTATCSNVLNVIAELDCRLYVIETIARYLKSNGTAYFTVYEGDKSGKGRVTKVSCWQENRKLASYVAEVKVYFKEVSVKNGIICAKGMRC